MPSDCNWVNQALQCCAGKVFYPIAGLLADICLAKWSTWVYQHYGQLSLYLPSQYPGMLLSMFQFLHNKVFLL